MTGNIRFNNSAQVGHIDVTGRRSSQTLVARTILAAGLILSILLAPFVIVDNDVLAAPIADHECETCAIEAARFSDSGLGKLFVTKAARSAAASAARYSAMADFYLLERTAGMRASAARYSGLAALYAAENAALAGARATRFNGSGTFASLALRDAARYEALTAFYAAEYRPTAQGISAAGFNDSGVGTSLALR